MYDHELLDLSPNGIKAISNLLNIVFDKGNVISPEFLDWEYNQNPVGKAVGYNAIINGEMAAHYVTQPIMALIDGKKNKGLLSLNTATHPNHRGKKLFTTLADLTYNFASQNGYKFVIGVANANSTPGFLKKLGFQLIKPLDVKYGLGNLKFIPLKECYYQRYWDKDLLKWRLSNPNQKYSIIKGNKHFFINAATGKFGIRTVMGYFPMEMLPEDVHSKIFSLNPAKIWMGIDNSINWKHTLYMNFPDKLKPSPLNLIFKDLTNNDLNLDPDRTKFFNIDFDAY